MKRIISNGRRLCGVETRTRVTKVKRSWELVPAVEAGTKTCYCCGLTEPSHVVIELKLTRTTASA